MAKEKSKELKKDKWKNSLIFILISFLTFFLFSLSGFRTDSMARHVEEYHTHFITGDILIQHDSGTIPASLMMPRTGSREDGAVLIKKYPIIEEYLSGIDDIASFTPFSTGLVTCMNKNKGKISFWLKIIEPKSFSQVFPEIEFTCTDESPAGTTNGIHLPQALVQQVEDLLKLPLAEGDFLLIGDEYARISSVREIAFSGLVSYRGYAGIFPWTAYACTPVYPFRNGGAEAGDEMKNTTVHRLPGEDQFYRDFVITEPSIQRTVLPDSYFFNFFKYDGTVHDDGNSHAPGWQYIALSAGRKSRIDEIQRELERYFDINNLPLAVSTWKEAAGSMLESVHDSQVYNVIITSFLLLLIFFISIVINRKYAQLLKGKDKQADTPAIMSLIKETAVSLNIGLCISALAGIAASVITVWIINTFSKDGWKTIFTGDYGFSISVSPGPFPASLLIMAVLMAIMNIYPLFLLACHQQPGIKEKS